MRFTARVDDNQCEIVRILRQVRVSVLSLTPIGKGAEFTHHSEGENYRWPAFNGVWEEYTIIHRYGKGLAR